MAGTGKLTDPGSVSRANVIIDTNAGMAAGYTAAIQSNTLGARLAFPAQELIRIEERQVPRNWSARWTAAGGHLYQGRMIALKEDPVWTKISRFGTPYPPFDFNSGMGVEDVSYEEAVELGVIKEDYQPPEKSPMKAFNEKLEADCEFKSDNNWALLKTIFGDQIRQDGDKIVWRQEVFRDAFMNRKQFRIEIGSPTSRLLGLIPDSDMALQTAEKPLVVTQQWLDRRRGKDRTTDHRIHFQPMDDEPNDIPLTMADVEMIPALWREPDRVTVNPRYKDTFMCEIDTPDGAVLKMAVDVGKEAPSLRTLYKVKKKK